jgi:tripartite-type tricarboxylate transporter receptor subunit TctC
MKKRLTLAAVAIVATALGGGSGVAFTATTYPVKPVRMIVGFAPGGGTDVAARILAQRLTETLRQNFVVENRPGASGIIGTDFVAKSTPDGYTLSVGTTTTHSVAPQLVPNVPYHPIRDFAGITQIANSPLFLVVHPSTPIKSAADLIKVAKSRPNELIYGSGGIGTTPHMAGELFKLMSGTQMMMVPYKGEAPAVADLLGGQISLIFSNLPVVLPHVTAGKLRGVAMTSPQRIPHLPQFPTVAESGLPGYQAGTWFGFFAPAATPREIVTKLSADAAAALKPAEVKDKIALQGMFMVANTPDEFAPFLKAEYEKWGKVIRDAKIKGE